MTCCVPNCPSSRNKSSSKDVRFHEFPVNMEVRQKWLRNVGRKDWTPADRSHVCSRHFLSEDYRPGTKVKCLKKDAVPSVFDGYPKCLQDAARKSVETKRKASVQRKFVPPPKETKYKHTEVPSDAPCVQEEQVNVEDLVDSLVKDDQIPTTRTPTKPDDDHSRLERPVQTQNGDERIPTATAQRSRSKLKSGTGKRGRIALSPATLRRRLRSSSQLVSRLRAKHLKVKSKLVEFKLKCHSMEQTFKGDVAKTLVELQEDASRGSYRAAFLLDQIGNYKKAKPRWRDSTLCHALMWHLRSPEGYEFGRSTLLQLPSRATLQRCAAIAARVPVEK